jgi:hypothetical protein
MVHAARASTASAPAPPSAPHPLIDGTAIRNARNCPENNALHFSNRPKTPCFSARFSRVLRSRNHHSPVTYHASRLTTHQTLLTNHAFLIATQILDIHLTRSQQTRKHFLIATKFDISAPHFTNHHSPIAPFLFNTNKPHRIIILMRPLLKTKEKQFSIQYKFALRDIGLPTEAATSLPLRPELNRFLRRSRANYLKIEIPFEVSDAANLVCAGSDSALRSRPNRPATQH